MRDKAFIGRNDAHSSRNWIPTGRMSVEITYEPNQREIQIVFYVGVPPRTPQMRSGVHDRSVILRRFAFLKAERKICLQNKYLMRFLSSGATRAEGPLN